MRYPELLERIETLYARIGPQPELESVIAAGKIGELDRAFDLLVDVEAKVRSMDRRAELERRIASVVASDREIVDLQRVLVLDGPDVLEPQLKVLEDRELTLRVKSQMAGAVELGSFLGEWRSGHLYTPGDVVRFEDALYVCVFATKTAPPSDAWEVLVAAPRTQLIGIGGGGGGRGATGATGPTGPTGPPGDGSGGGDIAEAYFLGADE